MSHRFLPPLKGGNPKSLAEITFSPPPPLFALGWIRQSRFPSSRKGGGGDESTFPNLSPLLFAFSPQPTTHHTFRRRAAASSLPLPLSIHPTLSVERPHIPFSDRWGRSPWIYFFWHILIPFSREMRTIFIQKFTYVRYTASAFPIQGRVNLNLELLVETREEETYMCT